MAAHNMLWQIHFQILQYTGKSDMFHIHNLHIGILLLWSQKPAVNFWHCLPQPQRLLFLRLPLHTDQCHYSLPVPVLLKRLIQIPNLLCFQSFLFPGATPNPPRSVPYPQYHHQHSLYCPKYTLTALLFPVLSL